MAAAALIAEKAKEFAELAKTAAVPDHILKFLKGQGIDSIEDMSLAASSEVDVDTTIIATAKAASVKFDKLSDSISTKKLWMACRKKMETKKPAASSGDTSGDQAMPDDSADDVSATWLKIHGIVLPDDWMLTAILTGKLWRGAIQDVPRVDVVLAENLRRMSSTDKSAFGTVMSAVPGKAVEAQVVYADSVTKPIELYLRCRAWFVTMAYVSIKNQAFMDFQTALFASDKVLAFVTQSFKGHYAPMTFYVAAWAATLHHFSEVVRIQHKPLKEIIMNTGTWEHKWTNWSPPADGQQNFGSDLPKSIQEEMGHLKSLVKDWQRKADGYRTDLDNYRRRQDSSNNYGNSKGKTDGKGKFTGKGKGSKSNEKRGRDERDTKDSHGRDNRHGRDQRRE